MTAGRKRPTPRARHVTHQDGPKVPGQGDLPTGRKAERKAASARAKETQGRIVNAKVARQRLEEARERREEET